MDYKEFCLHAKQRAVVDSIRAVRVFQNTTNANLASGALGDPAPQLSRSVLTNPLLAKANMESLREQ